MLFGIHNYTEFVLAIAVFQLIPGPGTLTILNATTRDGIRSGMGAVFGTLIGDLLFMVAAVLGLAAVLAANPVILSVLQWLGIAYLCWIGLNLLRHPVVEQHAGSAGGLAWFRQSFAVCLSNPKVIMFFMAFFPLFLTPDSGPQTLGVMMAHVSVISFVYQSALVLIGNAVMVRLGQFNHMRLLTRRLAGLGLIGFGIKLAVTRR